MDRYEKIILTIMLLNNGMMYAPIGQPGTRDERPEIADPTDWMNFVSGASSSNQDVPEWVIQAGLSARGPNDRMRRFNALMHKDKRFNDATRRFRKRLFDLNIDHQLFLTEHRIKYLSDEITRLMYRYQHNFSLVDRLLDDLDAAINDHITLLADVIRQDPQFVASSSSSSR